ncbi:hypothetical protein C8R44DRAFT_782867 [Mycena epipterygia]|nr:hypothetical protein C8R44DRAFT_782867 [Mycena epipterygia]
MAAAVNNLDPQPAPVSEPGTVLQKTAKRFQLHNPIAATDALWRAYANNRLAARGIRKCDKKAEVAADDTIYVLRSIRRTMRELEDEMGLPDGILQKSVVLLSCEAAFEESYDPRTVSNLSRIYSPSRPAYVDVHLSYHCRMRYNHLEWHFSLGYKIYTRPQGLGPAKEKPADLNVKKLKENFGGGLDNMHVNKGWRSIAWATWDDLGGRNFGQRRVEYRACDLYDEGIVDLYEALFRPLPESDGE